jgi:CRP/FNR family transcriptional regulator
MGCAIRNSTICKAVSPAELSDYAPLATEEVLSKGTVLAEEGFPADSIFIMREGIAISYRISHSGKRQIVHLLFPADVMGTIEPNHHLFSLQATTDIRVCRFDRKALENYFREHPAIEAELLLHIRRKIFGTQEHLVSLTRQSSLQAVASFIYFLQIRQRYSVRPDPGPVRVPFSRADVCDFLSLTAETVSRCFSKLRTANIIRMNTPDEIVILDESRLFVAANQKFQKFDTDTTELWA